MELMTMADDGSVFEIQTSGRWGHWNIRTVSKLQWNWNNESAL